MQDITVFVGREVRHADGRSGRIVQEHVGVTHISLAIVDQFGGDFTVQLNSDRPDSGDSGWSWNVAEEGESEHLVMLGDHNLCML